MATVASGLNSGSGFNSSDTITSTTLNNHVNNATVTGIVNADVASNAAVAVTKLATITSQNVLGNIGAGNASVPIVGATGLLLDEDTMSTDSNTKGATQQSIKAYVDDNATKETVLVFNATTPITIADWDSGANGTQCTLEFEHLSDSAQSDPDTAATDINDAGIALSSNEFTLPEGTYDISVDASITVNTDESSVPGLSVIGFLKRKSDDNKILISNVLNQSDSISQNITLHSFIKGRIVVPNSPSSNTNVFDLRFVSQNSGSALIGQEAPTEFEAFNPNHVTVVIRKVKS